MKTKFFIYVFLIVIISTCFSAWHFFILKIKNTPTGFDKVSIHRKYTGQEDESEDRFDNPQQFAEYYRLIRTRNGQAEPGYQPGYQIREYQKALKNIKGNSLRRASYNFTERGPANVPGRTRGLVVLPGDPLKNTWIAGSVGGGIWKTTDGGNTWVNKTPDLPNLATTTLAYSQANPDIIYAGTGESFGSHGLIEIIGQGLFKSTDGGETWNEIPGTVNGFKFLAINRIIVDPKNPDILLISAHHNSERGLDGYGGIYKSIDGGQSWQNVYHPTGWTSQITYFPGDFRIQYAAAYMAGVAISTNYGNNWKLISTGMLPKGRIEIIVSPFRPNRLYAAVEGVSSGVESDFYISDDKGLFWQLVKEEDNKNNRNFFAADDNVSAQGFWNNTIAVNPFNDSIVYVGGVDLWKMEVKKGGISGPKQFISVLEDGTSQFMDFTIFNEATNWSGKLKTGNIDTSRFVSVELRFGPGKHQKAHLFETPANYDTWGKGWEDIPDSLYQFKDYVDVPFEVWDIENNHQLMLSFRDQGKNGIFDLIPSEWGYFENHSREYLYIHDLDYNANKPDSMIAQNGGQDYNMMYFLWPFLSSDSIWDPANLPESRLVINWGYKYEYSRHTTKMTTWTNHLEENGRKLPYVHADQHNIIPIILNSDDKVFKIINSNDGGVFQSKPGQDPGLGENDWIFCGNGFNTSQFYGVDKKHNSDEYIGGLQDNGTYKSPEGITVNASTNYNRAMGGDGFEAVWNYTKDNQIIISVYNNIFYKTVDQGKTWNYAIGGLKDVGQGSPFISRLANSKGLPDVLYTVGASGVWKSTNFGDSWKVTGTGYGWENVISMNVKVSLANDNIIWAGGSMSSYGVIYVSVDQGASFHPANVYPNVDLGNISGIATHPFDDSTAYVLFSFAGAPKILRTKDLGITWTDISGFDSQAVSSNGFPDVAVHSLLVLPNNPHKVWAGTEIGIFESDDDGTSWSLLRDGFPSVSVWDMKTVDNKVIIATHGRGIWTADLPDLPEVIIHPEILAIGVSIDGKLLVKAQIKSDFDSTRFLINGVNFKSLLLTKKIDSLFSISYNGEEGYLNVKLVSYRLGKRYESLTKTGIFFIPNAPAKEYKTTFWGGSTVKKYWIGNGFKIISIIGWGSGVHSQHPYDIDTTYYYTLKIPIIVDNINHEVSYDDIAIVEPGDSSAHFGDLNFWDYVVVEGTTDGINWIPLADGYDANHDDLWLSVYYGSSNYIDNLWNKEKADLLNSFNPGDTIFIRFKLFSDNYINSWGWVFKNLFIQAVDPNGINENYISDRNIKVYPNPFSQVVTIEFHLSNAGPTLIEIMDTQGRKITNLPMGFLPPGKHEVDWDASVVPDGIYIARVYNNGNVNTIKMIKK